MEEHRISCNMKIFSSNNTLIKEIKVNDKSYRLKEIMGEKRDNYR